MMISGSRANVIFRDAIHYYHFQDNVDATFINPYELNSIEGLLFNKNFVDTVQWHLEDIVRDLNGTPDYLLGIKRRIDVSNQLRTDLVEKIDELLFASFEQVVKNKNARLNSETPAWLLDRMSILQLKIYHFTEQTHREGISDEFKNSVLAKLHILTVQEADMELCFDQLMQDLFDGKKYMRLYKQMKMYNDPSLNPVLYANK